MQPALTTITGDVRVVAATDLHTWGSTDLSDFLRNMTALGEHPSLPHYNTYIR